MLVLVNAELFKQACRDTMEHLRLALADPTEPGDIVQRDFDIKMAKQRHRVGSALFLAEQSPVDTVGVDLDTWRLVEAEVDRGEMPELDDD